MSLVESQKTFIGYLLNLAREGEENRGALAELRSGLGREPGKMARVHKHVSDYLPVHLADHRWYYVTATLFGLFPKHREGYSLGRAFRPLKQKSDSMEARFVALLNAHPDDLDDHLRHAVSLLKANEQPFDWFRLLDDLLQWDRADGKTQLQWAQDFYRSYAGRGSKTDTDDEQTTEKEEGNDE